MLFLPFITHKTVQVGFLTKIRKDGSDWYGRSQLMVPPTDVIPSLFQTYVRTVPKRTKNVWSQMIAITCWNNDSTCFLWQQSSHPLDAFDITRDGSGHC